MDYLIEKATELGATSVTPIAADRSVLKLTGDRAEKRLAHWQGIAIAACEQSGRNTVTTIEAVQTLKQAIAQLANYTPETLPLQLILSLSPDGTTLKQLAQSEAKGLQAVILLSGPEGGWTPSEEATARQAGFSPTSLGPRVLRADTAPLAALAVLTCV
jgi:16S rRNA (uracil1498-N3)-methyltransferase